MKRIVRQKIEAGRFAWMILAIMLFAGPLAAQVPEDAKYTANVKLLYGLSAYQQGYLDSGCVLIRESVALDSTNAFAMELKGICELNDEHPEIAIEDLTDAIALDAERSRSWMYRGEAQTRLGHYEEALADFDEASLLDPEDTEILFYRAKCLTMGGNFAEAVPQFEKIASFEECVPYVKKYWALAVLRLDGPEKGCPMLRQAVEEGADGVDELLEKECKGK